MLDLILVLLAAAGGVLILWCLLGVLLQPVFGKNMVTLYYAQGDGDELEQKVRAYRYLREGRVAGGRLVVVDCGLSAMGLGRAQILRRRYDWVDYCPFPALVEFLAFHDPTADH